jgi:hypothetical protein
LLIDRIPSDNLKNVTLQEPATPGK